MGITLTSRPAGCAVYSWALALLRFSVRSLGLFGVRLLWCDLRQKDVKLVALVVLLVGILVTLIAMVVTLVAAALEAAELGASAR